MKQIFCTLLIGLGILFSANGLQAQEQALLIISETLDKEAKPTLSRIYLTKDLVVSENEDDKNPTTTLYNADKEELYIIDHKKKEYSLLSKADLEALSMQLKASTEQMELQLKQLPEEQQKLMREQLGKLGGGQEAIKYTRVSGNAVVKGWNSARYEGKVNDMLRQEIYVASYKELGRDKDEFKALLSLYTLLQDQLKQFSRSMPMASTINFQSLPGGKDGYPVKSISYNMQGKPEFTSSISSIEETTLPVEKMQVPANYKKKNFRIEK